MKSKITEPGLTADILKGKQSVRATFKLPVQIINLLSVAAAQLGVKQKALFDQLVEDSEVLSHIASESKRYKPGTLEQKRQKTYVLSRKSLVTLEKVAGQYGIARDVLVEVSISRLLPVIDEEKDKLKKRKTMLREMIKYQQNGLHLLHKAGRLLGTGDPLFQCLESMLEQGERNIRDMKGLIDRGRCLDDY